MSTSLETCTSSLEFLLRPAGRGKWEDIGINFKIVNMEIFSVELKQTLNKVLIWSDNFFNGERNYDFDIDEELYNLSNEYSVDFKQGNLLLIYNLLDFYCDAVKHSFKQIDKNYSISDARVDIKNIISSLPEANNNLELSDDLKKRLKNL